MKTTASSHLESHPGTHSRDVADGGHGRDDRRGCRRVLVAGPVRLAPGGSALARLWLPAGQRPARLTFLGDGGRVLGQVDVEAPAGAGALFEVVVEAAYDGSALKITDITDGTSNTLLVHEGSQGIIAILIGLLRAGGPRAPMATLQILGSEGQTSLMLPFLEQDNR